MDRPGILDHEGQQLPEDLLVEGVDLGVHPADPVGQFAFLPDQGVEALADHLPGDLGHPRQIDVGLDLRHLIEQENLLGDVDGHVADPLQVAVDLDGRRDEAQIPGGGLPQGQEADALLLDLHVELVDLGIALDDLPGQFRVSLQERGGHVLDGLFRQGAQVEEVLLDVLELPFVVRAGMRVSSMACPP